MKKYFVTGLIILLPVALTIAIVVFVFNLLTAPFLGVVKAVFERYDLFQSGFLFLNADQLETLVAQLLILVCLFALTVLLGVIARWFFFRTALKFAEYIVKKIPLVRAIYKTAHEVIQTMFTSKNQSFKQVVLVPFPTRECHSIGLVTREELPAFKDSEYSNSVAVFVPTTPNPTSGFLVIYKKEDLIYLDMKVEDAFKYIISCGLLAPPFTVMEDPQTHTKHAVLETADLGG